MEQSDLNAAHVFVAVVQRGSFTAAARALDLPKSTVSRRIAELEQRLGARLLQRSTRKLSLTDIGSAYFERAARAVRDLAEAEAAVRDSHSVPRGLLRVTAPPDIGQSLFAWTLPEFTERYPEVDLALDLGGRHVDLVTEQFDVALRAGHLNDSSLIAKRVFAGTFCLYASPQYLTLRGRPERPEDLVHHTTVVFGTSPIKQWTLVSPERSVSVNVHGRVAIKDFGYLRLTAVAGAGIALLPNFLVGPDLHRGRLEQVLPAFSHATDALYLVYPSREFLPAKTRVFLEFVEAKLGEWGSLCEKACAEKGTDPEHPFHPPGAATEVK